VTYIHKITTKGIVFAVTPKAAHTVKKYINLFFHSGGSSSSSLSGTIVEPCVERSSICLLSSKRKTKKYKITKLKAHPQIFAVTLSVCVV